MTPEEQIQGSPEWLNWRRSKITATDACVIYGVSPYKTLHELYTEKVHGTSQPTNANMKYGNKREQEAREWIEDQLGISFFPTVMESKETPWMAASLDGINQYKDVAIEIKWNNAENHEFAKKNIVPAIHFPQLQHQYFVSEVNDIYYVSCWKDEKVFFGVDREDEYIEGLIRKEREFYQRVLDKNPPPLCPEDYAEVEYDSELHNYVSFYRDAHQMRLDGEKMESYYRDSIVQKMGHRNAKSEGLMITRYERKGAVDYSKIPELEGIDLEKYRKPSTWQYRILEKLDEC
ncbi:MAG: YqaJ viral recombinase family protein [Bacteroidota bacterium]